MELNDFKRAKTRKGKRISEQKAGKLVEDDKNALFIKGSNVKSQLVELMKDVSMLKKPYSVSLDKKNNWKPFEDSIPLEKISEKCDCSLFMFGSHTKKRPNNLVIGRTYHQQILDMVELGVTNFKSMKHFNIPKILLGSKPILLFSGEPFETEFEYIRLKNLFIDFFNSPKTDGVRLSGLQHVISFTAAEGKVHFRCYRITLAKTGEKLPRVELQEMGPCFDMALRRHRLASDSLMKTALKQPKQLKPRKVKNVNKSILGTTFGRIHMKRQNYGELQTRKLKGLKRSTVDKQATNEPQNKKVRFSVE